MNRSEAGKKGGQRLVQITLRECICSQCGQPLPRRMRRMLGVQNHFDRIGEKGGAALLRQRGPEWFSQLGRMGGRGNTREKRLANSQT